MLSGAAGIVQRQHFLRIQHEALLIQCLFDTADPSHFVLPLRELLVFRRIHMNPVAPQIFRDIAGGVGHAQDIGQGDVAHESDQANADADRKCLVVPAEAKIAHGAAQLIGDLHCRFDCATIEQHAEFISPQSRQRIALAQLALQYFSELAQQFIAGIMPARVVDNLELVKIQVKQGMRSVLDAGRLHRLRETALELGPIDQSCQRIVRCLEL